MKKSELGEKTKQELMEIARKAGLAGRSKMNKDDLVSSLAALFKETKKTVPSKKSGSRPVSKAKLKAAPVKKSVKAKGVVQAKKVTTTPKVTPKKDSVTVKKGLPIKKSVAAKKPIAAKKAGSAKEEVQTKKIAAPKASPKEEASSFPLARKSGAPMSVTSVKVAPLFKKSSVNKNSVPVKVVKGPVKRRDRMEAVIATPLAAGKAETWQEKVEDTKFYLGAEERAFITDKELPAGYGDNRIVLMARDPHWAYVYWEINSSRIDEARRNLKSVFDQSRLILRVYDITGVEFNGTNAHSCFDIEIPNVLGNWYVNLGRPNMTYCIDIGYRIPDGGMFVLSRSNKITSPRGTFSEVSDEEWMSTEEEYKKIYAKSGGVGYAGSSAELAEALKKRLEKELSSGGVRGLEPKESSHKH